MGRNTGTTHSKVRKSRELFNQKKENGRRQKDQNGRRGSGQIYPPIGGFDRAMRPCAAHTRLFRLIYPISLPIPIKFPYGEINDICIVKIRENPSSGNQPIKQQSQRQTESMGFSYVKNRKPEIDVQPIAVERRQE